MGHGIAWTTGDKITEAIRWYLAGQRVGRKPIFDGVCAYCGALLHDHLNAHELGNKCNGLPVTVEGEILREKGAVDAQPPFLLRWAPSFFAQELPAVFEWDCNSNKLSLTDDHREHPPWRTEKHHSVKDPRKSWLYCESCHHEKPKNSANRNPDIFC